MTGIAGMLKLFKHMNPPERSSMSHPKPTSRGSTQYDTVQQRMEDNKKTRNRRRNCIAKASRKKNRRK